jgi:chromosome segregation ATPase
VLDRLNARLITTEADRDRAQGQALVETAKVRKSTDALSAVSVELADKIAELNRTHSELAQSNTSLTGLQATLDSERLFSQRLDNQIKNQNWQIDGLHNDIQRMNSDSKLRISILDEHVSNLVKQLGVEILNNKNLEQESKLIKSSRGYRFFSKLWKIKG